MYISRESWSEKGQLKPICLEAEIPLDQSLEGNFPPASNLKAPTIASHQTPQIAMEVEVQAMVGLLQEDTMELQKSTILGQDRRNSGHSSL